MLKVVGVEGGMPVQLADSVSRWGASWGSDGYIYLKKAGVPGIARMPQGGGAWEPVTTPADADIRHYWPHALPNGRGVLFTVYRRGGLYADSEIAVVDLKTGEHTVLMPGAMAVYAASGHLLVVQRDGTLMAAPFDQDDFTRGEAVPIANDVLFDDAAGGAYYLADLSISANGTLVYVAGDLPEGGRSELVWVDRNGTEEVIDPAWGVHIFASLALSPDDERLAVDVEDDDGNRQIRVKELPNGTLTPLTVGSRNHRRPVWSEDGSTITFVQTSAVDTISELRRMRSDGSELGASQLVLSRERSVEEAVYRPGEQALIFREGNADFGDADLGYLDLETGSINDTLLASEFNERAIQLSPDGRWLAYVSDFGGQNQVFVRPFPSVGDRRWQVSLDGGLQPVWAHNGRELFYRDSGSRTLTAASYTADSAFTVERRDQLFDVSGYYMWSLQYHYYDVTQDDQRFVFMRTVSRRDVPSVVVVNNFFEELRERVGR
ncbi:TolB family protein [Gemmatimonadota bacterium]